MSIYDYIFTDNENNLIKMSDFPKGEWQKIWDGLFWRFMHKNRSFFSKNPRMGMLLKTFDKIKVFPLPVGATPKVEPS